MQYTGGRFGGVADSVVDYVKLVNSNLHLS